MRTKQRGVVPLEGITPSRSLVTFRGDTDDRKVNKKKKREEAENEDDRERARGSVKEVDEEGVGTR